MILKINSIKWSLGLCTAVQCHLVSKLMGDAWSAVRLAMVLFPPSTWVAMVSVLISQIFQAENNFLEN